MSIKRLDDGRYEVDVRPNGRNGKRIRRKFEKKSEAVAYEKHVQFNHHNKEWLAKPVDKRQLSELKDIWWKYTGKHEEHGISYLRKIERFIEMTANPSAFQISRTIIAQYCAARRAQGIKASTINRELTTLGGMFTSLVEAELFMGEHPFRGIKRLKEQTPETGYLSKRPILNVA